MGKADKLAQDLGANLDESIGVREESDAPALPVPEPGAVGPQDGFTRAQGFGMMEIANIVADAQQIRQDFGSEESLGSLVASIKQKGLLQPIRIRWDGALGKHVVVVGGRRLKAAQLAELDKVPVICVTTQLSPVEVLEEMIFENQHRLDLSDIDVANSYRRYLDLTGCQSKDLAELLHVAPSTVSKALSLLDLDPAVQQQIAAGELSAKAGQAIAKIRNPVVQQKVATQVVEEDLPAEEVAKKVRQRQGPAAPKQSKKPPRPVTFRIERGVAVHVVTRRPISGQEVLSALERATEQARAALETE
jgi:ParB family chromosome partitioning protein